MRHGHVQAPLVCDKQRRPRTGRGRDVSHTGESVRALILNHVDEACAIILDIAREVLVVAVGYYGNASALVLRRAR